MRGLFQIATIDSFFNRFGAYHPVCTGVMVNAPQLGYIDTVISPLFPTERLSAIASLSHGDTLVVDVPDHVSTPRDFGTLITATAVDINSLQQLEAEPRCPACGGAMVQDTRLWCTSTSCSGRLLARVLYLGSAEGLNYPWIGNRDLAVNLINHLRLTNLSRLFSWAELTIIEPDVLPTRCRDAMLDAIRLFRLSYLSAPPQTTASFTMSLLNALSYPGLDNVVIPKLVTNGITQFGAIYLRDYLPIFTDMASLQMLLPGLSDMAARFMLKQLSPFAREFQMIAEELSPTQ